MSTVGSISESLEVCLKGALVRGPEECLEVTLSLKGEARNFRRKWGDT